ncbi:MAG: carboxylate-amine ligase [Solirubrobacterales bacterium]
MPDDTGLDLDRAREIFESSQDFTVGLEEEFAIVDPQSLELAHRYEELSTACREDDSLGQSVAGELIDTEIEIRSGKGESFAEAAELQRGHRAGLFAKAEGLGLALAATGTHPWADYLDQRIIDTAHYRRLAADLAWAAQRNNTWSLHVHVGVRGADRAIAVCDAMRELLPLLLAASANSPFLDGRDTGLHTVRTEIFTRTFPRCGIHESFGSWADYAEFIALLHRTSSIVEATQLWWSVRPHHRFGTVEVRICDAQTSGEDSFGLAALLTACVAQLALDFDDGALGEPRAGKLIEENLWRAIRFGMDGKLIDFEAGREVEAAAALERVVEWTAPAREALELEAWVPSPNGAQRGRQAHAEGASVEEIYREAVEETKSTYAAKQVKG